MKGLVILPTYNEADNIEELTGRILDADERLQVLIVDDNSPDGTGAIADRLAAASDRVRVLHREKKMGLATAYITGFRHAISNGYDLVFEMDADFSHDPCYLAVFLDRIASHDVVIGSRYLSGMNVVNWPLHRLLLSYCANIYARLITGMPFHDLTSGFKCFRRRALEGVDLDAVSSEGYAFQIELNYICWKKGFQLSEIPIIFTDRTAGKSKMGGKIIIEAVWIVWKLKFLSLVGRL